ncbi:hypothetical protein L596_021422 [Steinernema carpocapsae]|uniref:Uncharacterized protein n=1 Tax=Steinernema carpocapsae TaxID=34508 RepID=A0A4U5MIN6_STECR|nr:hypothetical protein L596_021422 [Steinernema carpocapsae]
MGLFQSVALRPNSVDYKRGILRHQILNEIANIVFKKKASLTSIKIAAHGSNDDSVEHDQMSFEVLLNALVQNPQDLKFTLLDRDMAISPLHAALKFEKFWFNGQNDEDGNFVLRDPNSKWSISFSITVTSFFTLTVSCAKIVKDC